jgi:hypothetical protein
LKWEQGKEREKAGEIAKEMLKGSMPAEYFIIPHLKEVP